MPDQSQTEFYLKHGYIDPFSLLNESESRRVIEGFEKCVRKYPQLGPSDIYHKDYSLEDHWKDIGNGAPWFKSLHAVMPEVVEVAKHPLVLDVVEKVLGQDIMLWGSQFISKKPNEMHKWHVDVETLNWDSVNIWIGLENTGKDDACIQVISHSHLFDKTPQEIDGLNTADDIEVVKAAQKYSGEASQVVPDVRPGQCIMFHGKTWHGSFNKSNKTRAALLLQYSSPKCKPRIPIKFTPPIEWHEVPPPCVMVRGRDSYKHNAYI